LTPVKENISICCMGRACHQRTRCALPQFDLQA